MADFLSFVRPFFRIISQPLTRLVVRLRAERKAAESPVNADLMERVLDRTLARLRGGNFEDSWWRNLPDLIAQQYVAPGLLKSPGVQKWLADDRVAEQLKSYAKEILMGQARTVEEPFARVPEVLRRVPDETQETTMKATEAVVAILVAGYRAAIPPEQQPLAGMFQEMFGQLDERFDNLRADNLANLRQSAAEYPLVANQVVTARAKKELRSILALRGFNADKARRSLRGLLPRVEDGDLSTAGLAIRQSVCHWTARMCAMHEETLPHAQVLRAELANADSGLDLSIVDALIAETEGDQDKALRLLRDCDDPDSRSVWLALVRRVKGADDALNWFDQQDGKDDSGFFTSAGWLNWAVLMAELEQWEEALLRLADLEDSWEELPMLALVDGVINAAMLLPPEFRKQVLYGVPFFKSIPPNQGASAERCHARATQCFEFVNRWINHHDIGSPRWIEEVADWIRWLQLMNPRTERAASARLAIKDCMKKGSSAVGAIPFAYSFDIPFEVQPLKEFLQHRKGLGGLEGRELRAEFLLSARTLQAGDLISYLKSNGTRLAKVIPTEFLAGLHAEALLKEGQSPEKAEELAESYKNVLDEDQLNRLRIFFDAHKSEEFGEQLKAQYRQTGSLIDLRNLISHLQQEGDWGALQPLARELFRHSRTVEHALGVVASLANPARCDYQAIIEFLDENADILEQSDELKTARARAFFYAGRLEDSRMINDALLHHGAKPDNLMLDFNIAVTSGNWERLGGILDLGWKQREMLDPAILITLAQTAGHQEQIDNAIRLAEAAVEKAPNDPHILSAAYWLHFLLGRDEEANPDWLVRATALSSAEEGPVRRVSVRKLIADMVPQRRRQLREIERKWRRGEIPMSLAADIFNVSLARLLLDMPRQNASEADGRQRTVFPIIAGGREPVELHKDWTIGLDISSVLVLAHIGLLGEAIRSFRHVKLAPDVMELLFQEQREARFHQPSRIKAARQVLELHGGGRLVVADRATAVPESLVEEIGRELATLLHLARKEGGKVVCSLPIYKSGSLMDEEADVSAFSDLIAPIMDFCRFCHDRGAIGADDFRRAKALLESQEQMEGAHGSTASFDGPIFADELSLGYLLDAQLLRPITSTGIKIRVLPDVVSDMRMLTEAGYSGEDLAARIDRIRDVLRTAIDTDKASFLPRAPEEVEENGDRQIRFDVTVSLLAGVPACDAFCIDDRYINSRPVFVDTTQREIPIVCVLDVLRYLVSQGSIDVTDMRFARHKLRQGGFSWVLPDSEELFYWLRQAPFEDEVLLENAELRTLRQSVARAESLARANWQESLSVISRLRTVSNEVLGELWLDRDIPPGKAAKLSHWIWRNLMTAVVPARQNLTPDAYANVIRDLASLRLGSVLLPMSTGSPEQRVGYANWIENDLLQPLRPANADIVKKALFLARDAVTDLDIDIDIDKTEYGRFFLESLPSAARRLLINHDTAFAKQCGIQIQRSFSIGTDIQIADSALFGAARKVYATSEEESIEDLAGKEIVVGLDGESRHIVVKWLDAENAPQKVVINDLALVSPDPETRLAALREIRERLGPTAQDVRRLCKALRSTAPSDAELAKLLDETVNGVAAKQGILIQKIDTGTSFRAEDVVPSSIAYFERFCGPGPGSAEPETYLREVLIPYRRDLLTRDLAAGLDICALGALRDDLMPGQWVAELDNDSVWTALSSCDLKGNPFALLAGLDIALYRQDDERFRQFADQAVAQLTDETFGHQMGTNFFELLQSMYTLLSNRINLVEGGATMPGYWKRMSAWMQAGLFIRALANLSVPDTSDFFERVQQWAHENMIVAGAYSVFLDARREPMISAASLPQGLRNEILGRLDILRLRHEAEGRTFPISPMLQEMLDKAEESGRNPLWDFPGPLEGHSRPRHSVTEQFKRALDAASEEGESYLLESLVLHSQLFSFGAPEIERTRQTVRAMPPGSDPRSDTDGLLHRLEMASVVAAVSGDTALSDEIAHAAIRVSEVTPNDEVRRLLAVLLQAAVVHQENEAWSDWLEEKLTEVTARLPHESLVPLLRYLRELEIILPADCWFHLRARSVALAGST